MVLARWLRDSTAALTRARVPVLTIALAYALSIVVGIVMAHAGVDSALAGRDHVVAGALAHDAASRAYVAGDRLRAAAADWLGNVARGAVPLTVSGLAIVPPYMLVARQGWIGGIVSVRADRSSRLATWRSAAYYVLTLVLQVAAYSLAVGAGVNAGVAMLRPRGAYAGERWLRLLPKEAVRDAGRLYALAIPLFLIASLWEFLSCWNL